MTQDVIWAKRTLADHIPDFVPWSFAVPFGSYYYGLSNDPRAPKYFQQLLTENFKAVFLNNPPTYTKTTSPSNHLGRMELNHRVGDAPAVSMACRAQAGPRRGSVLTVPQRVHRERADSGTACIRRPPVAHVLN